MAWLWRVALSHMKPSRKALEEQGPSLVPLVQEVLAELRDFRAAWEGEGEVRGTWAERLWKIELEIVGQKDVLERLNAVLERQERKAHARAVLNTPE